MNPMKVVIDGNHLTIPDIAAVARDDAEVSIAPEAMDRMVQSRKVIDQIVETNQTVYGVNTGFGTSCNSI